MQKKTSPFLRIHLSRNLRRHLLQGHPWVYKDSVRSPKHATDQAVLCQVIDPQDEFVGWGIYDPHAPLALRVFSTDKSRPEQEYFHRAFARALSLRSGIISPQTNCYRLFNGEGDFLPGLICDVYNTVAVLQLDGQGPSEFWDREMICSWILENTSCTTVIEKFRRSPDRPTRGIEFLAGAEFEKEFVVKENGIQLWVNLEKGQKTGMFLDQRDNRQYVGQMNGDKTVLNLFSYTGGFSVYAGVGKAKKVASLDAAQGAIDMACQNWELNGLDPSKHQGLCVDVFDFLKADQEIWDHIIVDPPSMAHSEAQKEGAWKKYVEVFTASAKRVRRGGQLSLSSCTGHISFEDFFKITQESLSAARRKGQILRVSGQGADHPYPLACSEMRYLKYIHLALD